MRRLRRITDSRLASPWKRRHATAIRDTGHDPYRERGALPEPSACSTCGALFAGGKWTWQSVPEGANRVTCPACRRIADHFPAGILEVTGAFLLDHREEVVNLVRKRADLEREAHPLNRIATWEDTPEGVRITTTDTHTPRRIGEALKDAFEGDLNFTYLEDDPIVRVAWSRSSGPPGAGATAEPRMLHLEIQRGNVPLSGESEAYIHERVERLATFYPRILTCRITLEAPVAHHRQGGPYRVQIDLDVPGKVIAVNHREADDLHVAIRKAFEAAQRQLEDYARVQRGQVKVPVTGRQEGTIGRLFSIEGYGFIESENGHEVYFHQNAVLGAGFGALEVGQKVSYVEELGDEGPQASTVTTE